MSENTPNKVYQVPYRYREAAWHARCDWFPYSRVTQSQWCIRCALSDLLYV